jgi:lysophospholipase
MVESCPYNRVKELFLSDIASFCSASAWQPPEGAKLAVVETKDKKKLRVAWWKPEGPSMRGTIFLLHGRTEFIEKYFEVVADCLARGLAVVTFDWRGQGRSDRLLSDTRKGHVDDFYEYELDMEAVFRQVVLAECPPPITVLAHSTGGAVALKAAEKGLTRYDRMVLTSPLIGLGEIGLKQSTAGKLARALCSLGFSQTYIPGGGETAFGTQPFRNNSVTSDRKRYQLTVETLETCPELALGAPTIGWLNAACKAMEGFKDPEFRAKLHIPILFVACLQDRVVSLPAIEEIAVSLPSSTLVRIPGAKHEILMERDIYREQFWASFDAFLPDAQSSLAAG